MGGHLQTVAGRWRVLVADDDQPIRIMLAELLDDEGYEVVQAADGRAAIHIAKTDRPDVILMDLSMPVLDGVAAIRELKEDPTTRDIPIIAMSAGTNLRLLADQLPADGFLAKPFDLEAVFVTLALVAAPTGEGV